MAKVVNGGKGAAAQVAVEGFRAKTRTALTCKSNSHPVSLVIRSIRNKPPRSILRSWGPSKGKRLRFRLRWWSPHYTTKTRGSAFDVIEATLSESNGPASNTIKPLASPIINCKPAKRPTPVHAISENNTYSIWNQTLCTTLLMAICIDTSIQINKFVRVYDFLILLDTLDKWIIYLFIQF